MTDTITKTTAVAIYARFSTDRQDARSIDDQVRRCRDFAEKRGMEVSATFADEAISGAHMHRPELQRLLQEAGSRRGCRFSAVLVDDLSRLSRDLWNMGQIVFSDLAALNIPAIDVMTGTSSDSPHARQMFAALGMSNDFFLQMVKAETHRGLEGRALAGFATGGRIYGYTTVTEENAPDPEHPRKRPVVDAQEAAVVRRIFELYSTGNSMKTIAALLNTEGIPAPYSKPTLGYGRKGWPHTTIRNILKNRRYTGEVVWNKRKFARAPGRKHRTPRLRPQSEWVTQHVPELVIIPPELWSAVQRRLAVHEKKGGGRPSGTTKKPYPLSGSLRCGGSMSVVGGATKNGKRYVHFGCSAHYAKGESICGNSLSISERKLSDTWKSAASDATLVERFLKTFEAELARLIATSQGTDELQALVRQLAQAEKMVANLMDALANHGWSPLLSERPKAEEIRLATLQARHKLLAEASSAATALPSKTEAMGYLSKFTEALDSDPEIARELIRTHVGEIRMTPKSEGPNRFYEATWALSISPVPLVEGPVFSNASCGGRI